MIPAAPLHQIEGCPQDALVIAEQQRAWGRLVDPAEAGEDAVLSSHVVRRLDPVVEWRPAQDQLPIAQADEVGQVRMAVRELLDDERVLGGAELSLQITPQPREIELLARANGGRFIAREGRHRQPSSPDDKRFNRQTAGRSDSSPRNTRNTRREPTDRRIGRNFRSVFVIFVYFVVNPSHPYRLSDLIFKFFVVHHPGSGSRGSAGPRRPYGPRRARRRSAPHAPGDRTRRAPYRR